MLTLSGPYSTCLRDVCALARAASARDTQHSECTMIGAGRRWQGRAHRPYVLRHSIIDKATLCYTLAYKGTCKVLPKRWTGFGVLEVKESKRVGKWFTPHGKPVLACDTPEIGAAALHCRI